MDKGVRNTLFGIAAFIALILGLLLASIMVPRPMTQEQALELGFYRFDVPRVIKDFDMVNYDGEPVGVANLKGDWSILFFGFTTCPDICPTTLSVLADAVSDLPAPPQVVMVSVDPDRDSPEQLAQYVPAFNPDFEAYVGSFDETVNFAQQVNIAFGKVPGGGPGNYLVDHTASLVVVDPDGLYAGFIKSPHNAQTIQKIIASL